ncbi:MAG: hypothetical protein AMXMBFR56_54580 [Polyangiaceae bacterium]
MGLLTLECTLACTVPVSDPPTAQGTPQEPQQSGEQAETDLAVAENESGGRVLIAGYRYTGSHPLHNNPESSTDLVYLPGGGVEVARGASIMGWSYSTNAGLTWSAPGKIYPDAVFGDPMAVLWSDPALAVGMTNKRLVAYASLSVSTERFDQHTGGGDVFFGWPPAINLPNNIIDGLCVALSFTGGVSFPALVCKVPDGIGAAGTDQTTIAIGRDDTIYTAVEDVSAARTRLFKVVFGSDFDLSLEEIPMPTAMGNFSRGPELRRDQEGEVFLAATDQFTSREVRLCRVTPDGCLYLGEVTAATQVFADLVGSSVSALPLRSGVSVDFGVNHLASELGIRELVFVYSRKPTPDRTVVGATRCLSTLSTLLDCQDVPEWGTEQRAGQHFQPNLEFVDKSPEQNGSRPDWRYAFYEVDRPGVASGHAQLTLATLGGAQPSTNPLTLQYRTLVAPDPRVCTAKYLYGASSEYWGDYMGFTALAPLGAEPWRHVVAYSSDERRGCDPTSHPLQGRHLHVESSFWTD